MKKQFFHFIFFSVFFCGCMNNNLKPPEEIEVPSNFSKPGLSEKNPEKRIDFWKKFKNRELNVLMDMALKNNPNVKSAYSNLKSAKYLVKQADSVLYPQINAVGSAQTKTNKTKNSEIRTDTYSIAGEISYEADLFGKIRARKNITAFTQQIELEDVKTIYINLASNICELYYNLAALNKKKQLQEKQLQIMEKQKRLLQKRYESGVSDYSLLLDIKTEIYEIKGALKETERLQKASITGLTVLTGNFKNKNFEFKVNTFPKMQEIAPLGIPSEIIKTRPDVKTAYYSLKIKNLEVAQKTAERFPSFNLTAKLSRNSTDPDKGPSVYLSAWSLGGEFLAPVLDWGRRRNAVKEAKENWESSFYNYKETILKSFKEIEDSINDIEKLNETIKNKELAYINLKTKLKLSKKKYRLGIGSYSELLNSELEVISPQLELTDLKKRYTTSVISLAKACGAQWTTKYIQKKNQNYKTKRNKNESKKA